MKDVCKKPKHTPILDYKIVKCQIPTVWGLSLHLFKKESKNKKSKFKFLAKQHLELGTISPISVRKTNFGRI